MLQFEYAVIGEEHQHTLRNQAIAVQNWLDQYEGAKDGAEAWELGVRIGRQLAESAARVPEAWWPIWLKSEVGIGSSEANEYLAMAVRNGIRLRYEREHETEKEAA